MVVYLFKKGLTYSNSFGQSNKNTLADNYNTYVLPSLEVIYRLISFSNFTEDKSLNNCQKNKEGSFTPLKTCFKQSYD